MYRRQRLKTAEMERDLVIKLAMSDDPEDRERVMLQFYKQPNVNWARPVRVVLIGTIVYLSLRTSSQSM